MQFQLRVVGIYNSCLYKRNTNFSSTIRSYLEQTRHLYSTPGYRHLTEKKLFWYWRDSYRIKFMIFLPEILKYFHCYFEKKNEKIMVFSMVSTFFFLSFFICCCCIKQKIYGWHQQFRQNIFLGLYSILSFFLKNNKK